MRIPWSLIAHVGSGVVADLGARLRGGKQRLWIERLAGLPVDAEAWPELAKGALLAGRQASLAQHEAANRARHLLARRGNGWSGSRIGCWLGRIATVWIAVVQGLVHRLMSAVDGGAAAVAVGSLSGQRLRWWSSLQRQAFMLGAKRLR